MVLIRSMLGTSMEHVVNKYEACWEQTDREHVSSISNEVCKMLGTGLESNEHQV